MIEVQKKDANGTRFIVKIRYEDRDNTLRIWDVAMIPKGKRKPIYLASSLTDDYSYRRLNSEGRLEAEKKFILEHISEELLMEAVLEAWERMKPTELKF